MTCASASRLGTETEVYKSPSEWGKTDNCLGASLAVSAPRTCLPFRSLGELSLLASAEILSPPSLPGQFTAQQEG